MPATKGYGAWFSPRDLLPGQPGKQPVGEDYGDLFAQPGKQPVGEDYGDLFAQPAEPAYKRVGRNILTAVAPLFEPFQVMQQWLFAKTMDYIEAAKSTDSLAGKMLAVAKSGLGLIPTPNMDRFRSELAAYMPYGAQPKETIRFADILSAAGVKNERVLRWGGFAGDLLADPMLLGGWFSVLGKVGKSAELVRAGQAINQWMSPAGILKITGGTVDVALGKPGFSANIATGLARKIFEGEATAGISRWVLGRNTMLGVYGALGRSIEYNFRASDGLAEQTMNFAFRQFNDINQTILRAAGDKKHVAALLDARIQRFVDEAVPKLKIAPRYGQARYDQTPELRWSPKQEASTYLASVTGLAGQPNWGGFAEISSLATDAAKTVKKYKEEVAVLTRVAKQNGLDPEALIGAFESSVGKLAATHAELGYRLSGFSRFQDTVEMVASKHGLEPDKAMGMVFDRALGGTLKRPDQFQEAPFLKALDDAWKEAEPSLAILPISTYISGLANGYMRRVIGGHTNLKTVLGNIRSGRVVPYKEFDPTTFNSAVGQHYGEETAQKMSEYIKLWPGKAINMADLYSVARSAGVQESFAQFSKKVAPALSPDLGYIDKIVGALGRAYDKQQQMRGRPGYLGPGDVFAERQKLSETDLAELGRIESATASLAASGALTGKVLKVQEYMNLSYKMLKDSNLLLTKESWERLSSAERSAFAFLDADASQWGAMAGHYVPKIFANESAAAAARYNPEGLDRTYQNMLRTIRGLFLGNPGTVNRNLASSLLMLQAVGVDALAVSKQFPRASADLMGFAKSGELPADVAPYAHLMPFLLEGGLTKDLKHGLEATLVSEASKASTFGGFLTKTREGVEAFNKSPLGKGAMLLRPAGWLASFSLTERAMKLAVARHTAQMLQAGGETAEKAWDAASHLATHILFDYSNTSGLVEALKTKGLALFPAYSWFSMGRIARTVVENPGALAVQSRIAPAWNVAMLDDDEAARLDTVMAGWMRSATPLVVPLPGKDGNYFLAPLAGFMPFSTVTGSQLVEGAMGILSGGVLRPPIEAVIAMSKGDGRAVFSEKYGQRVFNPEDSEQQKLLASLLYVGQGFLPTIARSVYGPALSPFVGLNPSGSDPQHYFQIITNPDYVNSLVQGRSAKDINATLPQLLLRAAGLSTYRTSVIQGQFTGTQAQLGVLANLDKQKKSILSQLGELERKATASNDPAQQEIYQRQAAVLEQKYEELARQAQTQFDSIEQALRPPR